MRSYRTRAGHVRDGRMESGCQIRLALFFLPLIFFFLHVIHVCENANGRWEKEFLSLTATTGRKVRIESFSEGIIPTYLPAVNRATTRCVCVCMCGESVHMLG